MNHWVFNWHSIFDNPKKGKIENERTKQDKEGRWEGRKGVWGRERGGSSFPRVALGSPFPPVRYGHVSVTAILTNT